MDWVLNGIGVASNICMLIWAFAIVKNQWDKYRVWLFVGAHLLLSVVMFSSQGAQTIAFLVYGPINILIPSLVGLFVLLFRRKNLYLFYSSTHIVYCTFTVLLFIRVVFYLYALINFMNCSKLLFIA